jgi:hypothetical protein
VRIVRSMRGGFYFMYFYFIYVFALQLRTVEHGAASYVCAEALEGLLFSIKEQST